MSYYRITANGTDIYNPAVRSKTLINPVCQLNVEEAGYLEFTIDPSHENFDDIVPYGTDILVYEENELIFTGRPLPPTTTLYNQRKYHVEGIVAFLNDIIIPPMSQMVDEETEEDTQSQRAIYASDYIDYVFQCISQYQTNTNRVLNKGTISLEANPLLLYKTTRYMTALDILRQDILPYTGGYLSGRNVNGTKYIDIISEFGTNNQPIKAGVNLINFSASQNTFYTAVMAKGGPQGGDYNNDYVVTDTPVYMSSSIIDTYGVICAYKEFPESTNLMNLRSRCNTFLTAQQFDGLSINASAMDLHIVNDQYDRLELGRTIVFDSPMNGVSKVSMIISSMEIHLDTGEKTVTLGISEKTRLTQNWGRDNKVEENNYQFDSEPKSDSSNILTSGTIYEALHDTDETPTENSEKLISSGAVYEALHDTDETPTENSEKLLTSGAVYEALHDIDYEPTQGSEKLISSGAVYEAVHDTDDAPTENSSKLISSGAVYEALHDNDTEPTLGSDKIVTSNNLYNAIHDTDSVPTQNSDKLMSSGDIYNALHDTDEVPTQGSSNLISSGAVYDAIAAAASGGWVHQIDGVTYETGTVNFVTEDSTEESGT